MFISPAIQNRSRGILFTLLLAFAGLTFASALARASEPVTFKVERASQRLEMVQSESRILSLETEIPRVLVNNPDIIKIVPLSPTQVQVSALKPGVTQVNLWDTHDIVRSVDVVVFGDARQLELVLRSEFPNAALRVRPIGDSVMLAGYVDRPEVVNRVVQLAEVFYPRVINNIHVGGVQQVALNVKVMEVSRTKLRSIGFDWALLTGDDFVIQSAAGLIDAAASGPLGVASQGLDTLRFGIVDKGNQFYGFLEALRANNLIKILAEPTLVTVSGRPASFQEGGEFPIIVPQGLGTNAVEYKQFGTRVDFVPIVLGNGNIRLEVRPRVSEIDNSRGVDLNGVVVPGLRTRWVDTAVEMRAGQTLALAGLIQTREESESRGFPWLGELPWAGNLFRRTRDNVNEIELLVTVRPELVAALDPCQVPPTGPGQHTTPPNDVEFFGRGYLEVPRCCPDPRCDNACGGAPPVGAPVISPSVMAAPSGAGVSSVPYHTVPSDMDQGSVTGPTSAMGGNRPRPQQLPAPQSTPDLFGPSGYDELDF